MFCPQCQAEYRQGFTRCADCGIDLVFALADEAQNVPESPTEGTLQSVWAGQDTSDLADACAKLKDAGIPFKVVRREDRLFNIHNYPDAEIAVPPSLEEKALDVIYGPDDPNQSTVPTDESETEALMELPEQHDTKALEEGDDRYLADWYPEGATVEVWSETGNDLAWMIEASLRENRIPSRTEEFDDGSRKVFVLPEGEQSAREIIKEIVERRPRT
jgi:hypothetical protein